MKQRILLTLTAVILLAGCNPSGQGDELAVALDLAGDNRSELQAVLDHYSAPRDSLKRRAAEYLIGNMAGKYTVSSPALESLRGTFARNCPSSGRRRVEFSPYRQSLRGIPPRKIPVRPDTRLRKRSDLETIPADYLIRAIDASFDTWESTPWHRHYSFEQFCEYILPYRSMTEYLSDWKTDARRNPRWWTPEYDTVRGPVQLCHLLNRKIDLTFNHGMDQYGVPQSYPNLLKSHWGNCIDETHYALFQMRGQRYPRCHRLRPAVGQLARQTLLECSDRHDGTCARISSGFWAPIPAKSSFAKKWPKSTAAALPYSATGSFTNVSGRKTSRRYSARATFGMLRRNTASP